MAKKNPNLMGRNRASARSRARMVNEVGEKGIPNYHTKPRTRAARPGIGSIPEMTPDQERFVRNLFNPKDRGRR